jgi:hypothetical protein
MTNYLIPYVDPRKIGGHEDPILEEFTYGDINRRGKMLHDKVRKGDYLFFHTNRKGRDAITSYYVVERVLTTDDAKNDRLIISKYRNPHLFREDPYDNDTIVFGNSIYSKKLKHPIALDRRILDKLSARPKSISRPWVKLSDGDIKFLTDEINKYEEQNFLKDTFLSSSEVEQLLEEDIEGFIESNPQKLDKNLRTFKRQYVLKSGERADLILKDKEGLVVVEIKKGPIGRETYNQIKRYLNDVKNEFKCEVRGIIVCSDVSPAFEDFFLKKIEKGEVEIYLYSWKFNLRSSQLGV